MIPNTRFLIGLCIALILKRPLETKRIQKSSAGPWWLMFTRPPTVLHGCLPPLSSTPATHHLQTSLGCPRCSRTRRRRRRTGRSSPFLGVMGTDLTTKKINPKKQNKSQPPAQPNQLSGRQLCDSAIASVSSVCLLLFCRNTLTSRDVAGVGCWGGWVEVLHLCPSSETCLQRV